MKLARVAHLAYIVTIAIKGFDGALETLGGLVIWMVGCAAILG